MGSGGSLITHWANLRDEKKSIHVLKSYVITEIKYLNGYEIKGIKLSIFYIDFMIEKISKGKPPQHTNFWNEKEQIKKAVGEKTLFPLAPYSIFNNGKKGNKESKSPFFVKYWGFKNQLEGWIWNHTWEKNVVKVVTYFEITTEKRFLEIKKVLRSNCILQL